MKTTPKAEPVAEVRLTLRPMSALDEASSVSVNLSLGERFSRTGQAMVHPVVPVHPPRKLWTILGVPAGTPLVCRISKNDHPDFTNRRWEALRRIGKALRLSDETRGIVPILAVARHPDGLGGEVAYEIMPFAGEKLDDAARNARWNFGRQQEIVQAFAPMARALAVYHELNPKEYPYGSATAHRDIKPSNVFVAWFERGTGNPVPATAVEPGVHYDPVVRLGDPGSTYTTHFEPGSTATGLGFSAVWAPPEVIYGAKYADPRKGDVFSFAATLFYALVGRHPWPSIDKIRYAKVSNEARHAQVAKAYDTTPGVPETELTSIEDDDLRDLMRRALGDPRSRPTMRELSQVLKIVTEPEPEDPATAPLPIASKPVSVRTDPLIVRLARDGLPLRVWARGLVLSVCLLLVFGAINVIAFMVQRPAEAPAGPTNSVSAAGSPQQSPTTPPATPTATPTRDQALAAQLTAEGFTADGDISWKWLLPEQGKCPPGQGCSRLSAVSTKAPGCPQGVTFVVRVPESVNGIVIYHTIEASAGPFSEGKPVDVYVPLGQIKPLGGTVISVRCPS